MALGPHRLKAAIPPPPISEDALYCVERWSGRLPEKWRLIGRPHDTLEGARSAFDCVAGAVRRGAVRVVAIDPDASGEQEIQRFTAPSTARRRL